MRSNPLRHLVPVLLLAACSVAPPGPASGGARRSEVLVLGMIHGRHRTSPVYGIDRIQEIVRAVDPDFVLCEIPPDRVATALAEFLSSGVVREPRVRRFPEYVDAIFPLVREMGLRIVPCAAWTAEMAAERSLKLETWETTRPRDHAEMSAAQDRAERLLEEEGIDEDPLGIHTDRYDEIVREGMEPYDRLFDEGIGAGGWTHINRAHYQLIEAALDRHRGEGKRFLVTFGAWHKYWFLERLRGRDDVVLLRLEDVLAR